MEIPVIDRVVSGGLGADVGWVDFSIAPATTDFTTGLPAGAAGKRVYILGYEINTGSVGAAVTFNSKGGGAGTSISPTFSIGNNGHKLVQPFWLGIYRTNVAEGLSITTDAGTGNVTGRLWFYQA